jgi:hypothetical protein
MRKPTQHELDLLREAADRCRRTVALVPLRDPYTGYETYTTTVAPEETCNVALHRATADGQYLPPAI